MLFKAGLFINNFKGMVFSRKENHHTLGYLSEFCALKQMSRWVVTLLASVKENVYIFALTLFPKLFKWVLSVVAQLSCSSFILARSFKTASCSDFLLLPKLAISDLYITESGKCTLELSTARSVFSSLAFPSFLWCYHVLAHIPSISF